jgi:hypothetical protein
MVVGLSLLAASAPAWAANKAGECRAIAGAEPLLVPGAHIILGEAHGNVETPGFVAALACLATKRGPLRIALEIPVDEQNAIDTFLASAGTASDKKQLLGGAFWIDAYQDGRRSQAMAELLDSLRQLRRLGMDLKVVTLDGKDANRDQAMSERLLAAFSHDAKATFLVLCGNMHARKASGRWKQTFMATYVLQKGAQVTTLDARYGVGTTWVCMGPKPESCGPSAWGGPGKSGAQPGIALQQSPDGAYDGTFDVGSPSYSPPAAFPLTEAQKARAVWAQQRSVASGLKMAKKYVPCGDALLELAQRDATHRSDHAYDAACCFALGNAADRAFSALADAAAHGFTDADWLAKDTDLASLRSDQRWAPLLERVRTGSKSK